MITAPPSPSSSTAATMIPGVIAVMIGGTGQRWLESGSVDGFKLGAKQGVSCEKNSERGMMSKGVV
jgi:hypothetical protein